MKVNFFERNLAPSEALRGYLTKKLEKLDRFFDDFAHANTTFTVEKETNIVELTIYYHDVIFRVEEKDKDMYAAIDHLFDSLKRQIRKYKTRLEKKLRGKQLHENAWDVFAEDNGTTEEKEFKIIRSKQLSVKPMSPEEAILQMNLLGHAFFIFLNADTENTSVVYKRKGGHYGIIDTE